jgi:transcriptional regulator with XRE-family HTH domain
MARRRNRQNQTTLGGRLLMTRRAHGDAQFDLAQELGVSRAAVSHWELGQTQPTAENVRGIIERYNIPVAWLLYGKGPPPKLPPPQRRRAFRRSAQDAAPLVNDVRIVQEISQDGLSTRRWMVPVGCFPGSSGDLAAFSALTALDDIQRGDIVFVDRAEKRIERGGIWLVDIARIGRALVHSQLTNAKDASVILQIVTGDGAVVPVKSISEIIGRRIARLTCVG